MKLTGAPKLVIWAEKVRKVQRSAAVPRTKGKP